MSRCLAWDNATMPDGMNPAEFANIARSEREFWWYRGMRRIMFGLLDPVAQAGEQVLEFSAGHT